MFHQITKVITFGVTCKCWKNNNKKKKMLWTTWMLFFPAPAGTDKLLLAVCVTLEEHTNKNMRQNIKKTLYFVLTYCTNQRTTENINMDEWWNQDHRMTRWWWISHSLHYYTHWQLMFSQRETLSVFLAWSDWTTHHAFHK